MNSATITLSQLESHLLESANILRGPVDAADFKIYLFPRCSSGVQPYPAVLLDGMINPKIGMDEWQPTLYPMH